MLDIESWKEFRIGDFFDVFTGGDLILRDMESGCIPVCSHSGENNGVASYVNFIPGRMKFNCKRSICLADRGTFNATIQTADYYIGTRVKALVLKEFINASVRCLMFIATIINNETYRYSYGRNCTGRTEDIIIKLPVTSIGNPNWEYMNDFIEAIENKESVRGSLKEAITTNGKKVILSDVEHWKEFSLGKLFKKIYKAKAHIKGEVEIADYMDDTALPFITRTEENNACDGYVKNINIKGIENGNAIIIGDTTSTFFYQKEPFVAGDHIVVCRADWINQYTALFVKTVVEKDRYRYCYGRAYKKDLIESTLVRLPALNGKPNWEYMEEYIKSLPYGDRI